MTKRVNAGESIMASMEEAGLADVFLAMMMHGTNDKEYHAFADAMTTPEVMELPKKDIAKKALQHVKTARMSLK